LASQRGSQFVRCVRDELALRAKGRVESREQLIKRSAELPQLVVGAFERDPLVEIGARDLLSCPRDLAP
jgi:hypothetical protein